MSATERLVAELQARGFTWHPREHWLPLARHPWGSSPAMPAILLDGIVHWPGATSLGNDHASWMAAVHDATADPARSSTYNFKYNFMVTGDHVWEGRGLEYKNAANSGGKVNGNANDWTVSVTVYQPIGHAASMRECEAAAVIFDVADLGTEAPHSSVEWTECPGDGMRDQISRGWFNLAAWPIDEPEPDPPPEPEPPEEPDTVEYLIFDTRPPLAVWRSDGVVKSWVDRGTVTPHIQDREPVEVHTADDDEIASYGPIVGPIPEGFDTWGRLVTP